MYFNLDDDVGVLAARPDRLLEVRPQPGVSRRTAKQNVDVFTYPLLDMLVPQMGDQLVEVLRKIDTRSSHLAIDVPKVFPDSAPLRRVESRPPQLADQLVDVPTGLTLSSSWRPLFTEEQIQRMVAGLERGGGGARHGSRSGQESTPSWFRVVDNPVPLVRREGGGGVQVSLPARRAPD